MYYGKFNRSLEKLILRLQVEKRPTRLIYIHDRVSYSNTVSDLLRQ